MLSIGSEQRQQTGQTVQLNVGIVCGVISCVMLLIWFVTEIVWCVSDRVKRRDDGINCKGCGTFVKHRHNEMCNVCETIYDVLSKNLEKCDQRFIDTFIGDAIEMNNENDDENDVIK